MFLKIIKSRHYALCTKKIEIPKYPFLSLSIPFWDIDSLKNKILSIIKCNEFGEEIAIGLITLDDDEKPYKLILGKKDIQELNNDSTKFSSSLVSCV